MQDLSFCNKIPAQLDERTTGRVQNLAIRTFQVSCCEGMARVDFFLRGDGEVIVNEINTIPGFTRISMYPKLWEASGIPYPELIDRLIQLANRFKGQAPQLPPMPTAAWINPPPQEKHQTPDSQPCTVNS